MRRKLTRQVATPLTITTLLLGLVPAQGLALGAAAFVAPTCETPAAALARPASTPSAERNPRAGFEPSKGTLETGHAVSEGITLSHMGLTWHPLNSRPSPNEPFPGYPSAKLDRSTGSWWKGASTTTRVWTIVGIVVGVGVTAAALN